MAGSGIESEATYQPTSQSISCASQPTYQPLNRASMSRNHASNNNLAAKLTNPINHARLTA
jgi:hypothetical protein